MIMAFQNDAEQFHAATERTVSTDKGRKPPHDAGVLKETPEYLQVMNHVHDAMMMTGRIQEPEELKIS